MIKHGSHEHIAKPIAFDDDGIYMSLLVHLIMLVEPKNSSNSRAYPSRFNSSWRCWKFDANKTDETQNDGELFLLGLEVL